MKKETKELRTHFVKTRMNDAELNVLSKLHKQTTERSLSNYLRKVMLQKPVIIKYRNKSADELLQEMLNIKQELNAIGNNFNQAVKKLHILDKIPEFRQWINHHQSLYTAFLEKTEQVNVRMQKIYERWSQE